MASSKLSILVQAVGAAKAAKDLKGVDRAVSNIGATAGKGFRTAGSNLAKLGLVAGAGIAAAIKTGLDDLATLESAVTSVDGAIKQLGLTGKVTGSQVATWANEIEASVGAAFDDKDITAATATLIRFGHVAPANLRPAMVVMTDLAAKTGSVDSAAALLAKALADPAKAAGKLARAGVILTAEQQKQIKALVKAGKVGQAQKLILDALAKSTKGAAAASQGPYQRSLSLLKDVAEDARKALAEGFLPVIQHVAELLSTQLAKPSTLASLRDFGKTLASGLDSLIAIAAKVPWGSVADAMKTAGAGTKAVLEAFAGLPPWVQQAVLTGWGLNKLTGGALTGILGQVASGLIKGVLGMNAGVVNIKAGVVNGGGAAGGAAGAGGGLAGKIGTGLAVASAAILSFEAIKTFFDVNNASTDQAKGIASDLDRMLASNPTQQQMAQALDGVNTGIAQIQSNPLMVLVQGDALNQLKAMKSKLEAAVGAKKAVESGSVVSPDRKEAQDAAKLKSSGIEQKLSSNVTAVNDVYDSLERNRSTLGTKTDVVAARVTSSSREIVTALRSLHFTLDVKGLTVTARDVSSASNTADAYAVPTAFNRGWVPVGI